MGCKYENYIDDMLWGKLTKIKEQELFTHAGECSECNNKLKNIERMDLLIKETVAHSTYKDFTKRTIMAINYGKDSRSTREFIIKHRKAIISFAAVLLAAVMVYSYYIFAHTNNPAGMPYGSGENIQSKYRDYSIHYNTKAYFPIANINYGDEAQGYIMGIDGQRFLVVGTNISLEYKQLHATWINVSKTDSVYKDLQIGTKVRYVNDGPTFTSYPGQGGIKITGIAEHSYPDVKSKDRDIVNTALDVLKDIDTSGKYYICSINNLGFWNGIWSVNIVKDSMGEKDNLSYYTVRIQDDDKRVLDITIYQ